MLENLQPRVYVDCTKGPPRVDRHMCMQCHVSLGVCLLGVAPGV